MYKADFFPLSLWSKAKLEYKSIFERKAPMDAAAAFFDRTLLHEMTHAIPDIILNTVDADGLDSYGRSS